MSPRETNILWLRDILEHLSACQQQLQWTDEPDTTRLIADNMLRDLERCQRLVETLRQRSGQRQTVG